MTDNNLSIHIDMSQTSLFFNGTTCRKRLLRRKHSLEVKDLLNIQLSIFTLDSNK
jgi:hypothetical protein